jgi:Mg2+-importing ATPase
MAPIQILVNNLLYDISQTSIPTDRVDHESIAKPLNWDISFVRRFMMFIGPISSIFDYATFFLMLYVFNCRFFTAAATTALQKVHYEQLFHTAWFVESLLTQTMIVWVLRTNKIPFLQSRPSTGLMLTTLAVMGMAIALPYSPLAPAIGLVRLPGIFWAWMAGFCSIYFILTHFVKVWFNRRFGV